MQTHQASSSSAFIEDVVLQGSGSGPLAGMSVAVKDLFDMQGHKTGFGHPLWRETHPVASSTAPPVAQLLAAGATIRGRTHMDELAYSLNGENAHYGTPHNAAAPGRVPGGSSSGSAAAVAAGDVDIGLGSDTGGSVRIPASYCGLFGIRPSHGRVSLEAACPLAPSFDTVGWFTRSMADMQKVSDVLLHPSLVHAPTQPYSEQHSQHRQPLTRLLIATDAFALADPPTSSAVGQVLQAALQQLQAGTLWPGLHVGDVCVATGRTELADAGLGSLLQWFDAFRVCQAAEIWQQHGDWIQQHKPQFGPGVKERFEMASSITPEERRAAQAKLQLIQHTLAELLGTDGVLAMPTAPGPAPLCQTPAEQLNDWRTRLLSLTCVAGLAGLPQVSLPVASVEGGLPVGLSLVGPKGKDEELLAVAARLTAACGKA